jgi:hypothetical protein
MTGMIQGGWEFVWAAYGITGVAMGIYIASLWIRWKAEDKSE